MLNLFQHTASHESQLLFYINTSVVSWYRAKKQKQHCRSHSARLTAIERLKHTRLQPPELGDKVARSHYPEGHWSKNSKTGEIAFATNLVRFSREQDIAKTSSLLSSTLPRGGIYKIGATLSQNMGKLIRNSHRKITYINFTKKEKLWLRASRKSILPAQLLA